MCISRAENIIYAHSPFHSQPSICLNDPAPEEDSTFNEHECLFVWLCVCNLINIIQPISDHVLSSFEIKTDIFPCFFFRIQSSKAQHSVQK